MFISSRIHDRFQQFFDCRTCEEEALARELEALESCLHRMRAGRLVPRLRGAGPQARWQDLLETVLRTRPSHMHLWCLDVDGRFLFANGTAAAALGRSAADLKGLTFRDVNPGRSKLATALDRDVLVTGRPFFGSIEAVRVAGVQRLIRVNRVPWMGADGVVLGVLGLGLDITDLRAAGPVAEKAG